MKRATLNFGLIAAALIFVYSFIVFTIFGDISEMSPSKFHLVETLGYLRYIILILAIIFTMRTFRGQEQQITGYWPVVKQGMMVVLIIAIGVGLMEYIYILMHPDFFEKMMHLYAGQMKAGGASAEQMAATKKEMENYKWIQTPVMTGVFYFFETSLIGTVATLISGFFFKS